MYSSDSAGDRSRPTGGSCAESPTRIIRQSTPLRMYRIRSSSRLPEPKAAVLCRSPASMPMSDTSSTMKSVFFALFGAREN